MASDDSNAPEDPDVDKQDTQFAAKDTVLVPGNMDTVRLRCVKKREEAGLDSLPPIPAAITEEKRDPALPSYFDQLCRRINSDMIGTDEIFDTPFGSRRLLYCDYTASGRSLHFIEDYISAKVLPLYGNTHTRSSVTSLSTTLFREDARNIIRRSVNATADHAVIFAGSGTTSAIHLLIHGLCLERPPIVFVGPWEHHSNLLPWREIADEVIRVHEARNGTVDVNYLFSQLWKHRNSGRQMIGCFSAASNITGQLADTVEISSVLHGFGAYAFFDYATAAPYVEIDMEPKDGGRGKSLAHKDALYFSVHKFVGGVQTPGVLVARKSLFGRQVPVVPGGGSVAFVRRNMHHYLGDIETREEAGTPGIVESIRAGLVFEVKESVGTGAIMQREEELCSKAFDFFATVPNLYILGSHEVRRLPILSFLVHHAQTGRFLHYNFVALLLNDLFGIQCRGGCSCAGPYGLDLLGIKEELAAKYETLFWQEKAFSGKGRRYKPVVGELYRPGFTRLNFAYFMSDEEVDFVLEAVKFVATHGWKLLPLYTVKADTAEWIHFEFRAVTGSSDQPRLAGFHMTDCLNEELLRNTHQTTAGKSTFDFAECLRQAEALVEIESLVPTAHDRPIEDMPVDKDDETRKLRWFLLPAESSAIMHGDAMPPAGSCPPFWPVSYPLFDSVVKQRNVDLRRPSARTPRRTQKVVGRTSKTCVII